MLQFVLQKMRNKKWMAISLLIGNLLLVAIACCNPMYTKAVLQRMLTRNLADQMMANNRYPTVASFNTALTRQKDGYGNVDRFQQALADYDRFAAETGVPEAMRIESIYLASLRFTSVYERDDANSSKSLQLGILSGLPQHIDLVAGRLYSGDPDANGVMEVIVSESAMVSLNLLLDEELVLDTLTDEAGESMRVRVVGVFRNSQADDLYWYRTPSSYSNMCFMDEGLFRTLFYDLETPRYPLNGQWYVLLDYEAMRGDRADHVAAVLAEFAETYGKSSNLRFGETFSATLQSYRIKARQVGITLAVLQAPIFVLLAAFIFMVSKQLLQMERNEMAILKSRGASKGQIIGMYLMQSLLLALMGGVLGIPLGIAFCQVLGSANAFLQFVQREPLEIELNLTVLLYALGSILFSTVCMVLPVFKYADVTIVTHKQKKSRHGKGPIWQRLYLDVVALGVSLYGLYSFNGQRELLAQRVMEGAALDPLLFLSSSLFILGAGLLAARLAPALSWAVFQIGKRFWSPALYASFLRVLRTRSEQGFIMVFIILTIALGLFNAQTAHTINLNEEDRIRYQTGADIRLMERWDSNAEILAQEGNTDPAAVEYYEPNFHRFGQLEGVARATKVYNTLTGSMSVPGGTLKNIHVMGIHTKEFGEIAWMKDGLLSTHWYNYLNVISQNSRAVLVSRNFQDMYGYRVGDVIYYKIGTGNSIRGIIYGFLPYFPTHASTLYAKGADGLYKQSDHFLIVGHLSQIQAADGVKPYEVWIRTHGDTQFLYDFIDEAGLSLVTLEDASAKLVTLKNDPIFQGTNGILTVSFIVVLLLCMTGFLIYWVLSIQSRTLQFGIFRAMGMTFREILTMLLNEQLFISGMAILSGSVIGLLASRLYIPLIQISYAASDRVLPLTIVSAGADTMRLYGVVGVMMVGCLAILGILISRIKISQALKLGED